jgi:DNA-binding winged helix-turn-helix (wHTH) protein
MTSPIRQLIPSHTFGGWQYQHPLGGLVGGNGTLKPLRAKTLKVFEVLYINVDQIVSKEDIINSVWPDTITCDDSLVQCILEIRRALEDSDKRILITAPRIGYRLVPDSQLAALITGERGTSSWLPLSLRDKQAMLVTGAMLMLTVFTHLWLIHTADEQRQLTDVQLALPADDELATATRRLNVLDINQTVRTSALDGYRFAEPNHSWVCVSDHTDEQCLKSSMSISTMSTGNEELLIDRHFRTKAGVEITRRYYNGDAQSWWANGSMWNVAVPPSSKISATF